MLHPMLKFEIPLTTETQVNNGVQSSHKRQFRDWCVGNEEK